MLAWRLRLRPLGLRAAGLGDWGFPAVARVIDSPPKQLHSECPTRKRALGYRFFRLSARWRSFSRTRKPIAQPGLHPRRIRPDGGFGKDVGYGWPPDCWGAPPVSARSTEKIRTAAALFSPGRGRLPEFRRRSGAAQRRAGACRRRFGSGIGVQDGFRVREGKPLQIPKKIHVPASSLQLR